MPAADTAAILQAAIDFHNAGICVVPVREDGSKAPDAVWKEYQTRRPTGDELAAWFSTPRQGLGIVTGKVSGNLEMLELEGRAVTAGMLQQIRDILVDSGLWWIWALLADTYMELTPSGGIHWLYRTEEDVPGNTKLARRPGENGGVEVLAETRGEGGFVVTAPSAGTVHPSGEPWRHVSGSPDKLSLFTAEDRGYLFDVIRSFDRLPKAETVRETVHKTSGDSLSPGDDFNERGDWADILSGWKVVHESNGVTYWRRPGKDIGMSATTGRNDGDNLYVFSTSTQFEAETPYSKFAAYTLLEHNGDYSAAARALRAKGFGSIAAVQPLSPLATSSEPLAAPEPDESDRDDDASSWKPVDLQPHIDGTHIQILPSLLARNDGVCLLYKRRVHSFYGESESGKSWLAQHAVAEVLKAGGNAVYIDFEADASDIVDRLLKLGAEKTQLANLTYIRPETAPGSDDPHWLALLGQTLDIVIIDGVTEALNMWGGATKENDDITLWTRRFPRRIARETGAAVVTIDHVAKDKDTRGRFAIGGQAKLASIDGAAYLIEPIAMLAPGHTGRLSIRVTKDRPGGIRKHADNSRKDRTSAIADAVFDSTADTVEVALWPSTAQAEADQKKDKEVRERIVSKCSQVHPNALTENQIVALKGRSGERMREIAAELAAEGFLAVEVEPGARGAKKYRFATWEPSSGASL